MTAYYFNPFTGQAYPDKERGYEHMLIGNFDEPPPRAFIEAWAIQRGMCPHPCYS